MGRITEGLSNSVFRYVHGNNLVYNTCWEDPRLDREALQIGPRDNVLVITSAGCNALDYALCSPNHVFAVDLNPRQNALLELKIAGIRKLDFQTFFQLFGRGKSEHFKAIYQDLLRHELSDSARQIWDRKQDYFLGTRTRPSFYFRGTAGFFARLFYSYINLNRLRGSIEACFEANSLQQQHEIYHQDIRSKLFTRPVRWLMRRDTTLSLLGVPRKQRELVDAGFKGGIAGFVEDAIESVFTRLPLDDNYFWYLYFSGAYTPERCPEYLRAENFHKLKSGLVDRISVHTNSVAGFLQHNETPISRFVLLDHMDWLAAHDHPGLQQEWQAIFDRATPKARALWRSGGPQVDFVDPIEITLNGQKTRVGDHLEYHNELANRLHQRDRVHTYASFSIADLHS